MALYRFPKQINNVNLHPAIIQFQFFERGGFNKQGIGVASASDTIQVFCPDQIQAPSTVSWSDEQFGIVGNAVTEMLKGNTTAADIDSTITGVTARIKHQAVFNTVAKGINATRAIQGDVNVTGTGVGGQIAGKIPNPYAVAVFRGVDFRKFSFGFQFTPLSEEDCILVDNIVKTFRKHQLPYYADEGSFLNYPSEAAIAYFWKGKVNNFLPRFKKAVCTGVDVNYVGTGTFSAFRNGMPVSINVSTQWMETEIVTRQDVEDYGF